MIYIAGPFFNREQLAVVKAIEGLCTHFAMPCYSPRRDAGILPPNGSQADRTRVFKANHNAIKGSTLVIAITRYLLPEEHSVHVCYKGKPYETPMLIPDSGTVWEMGDAYALGIPCVAFHQTINPKASQLNLMLSESVCGCFFNEGDLTVFLDELSQVLTPIHDREDMSKALCSQHVSNLLKAWEGKIQ